MDQEAAQSNQSEPVPIFDVYRRGYDPEQVDRFVAEQQRRLDDTLQRATDAERKLAAAVGQLRELHRRVASLESDDRSPAPSLDMLGERVQRILQEAWEGAYALRQAAERDVAEQRDMADREVADVRERARLEVTAQRQQAERESAELLEAAQRRAGLMRAETDRRRQAYLDRVEEDRARAVNQITYLYDQRQLALGELSRLQATIESTVGEMAKSPLGVPAVSAQIGPRSVPLDDVLDDEVPLPRTRSAAPRETAGSRETAAPRESGGPPESGESRESRGPRESGSFGRARAPMPGLEPPMSADEPPTPAIAQPVPAIDAPISGGGPPIPAEDMIPADRPVSPEGGPEAPRFDPPLADPPLGERPTRRAAPPRVFDFDDQ